MRLYEFKEKNNDPSELINLFKVSLPIIMRELELTTLPKIKFVKTVKDDTQPTFGRYVNHEKTIYLAINNRHPIDIMRTFSHEMVHFKQDLEGMLGDHSGDTGSNEENQAHAVAGVIMRHIDKEYPKFLKSTPLEM